MSVKYVLLTDKSAEKGTLSVKFERNIGVPPRIIKNTRHHGTYFNQYSVAYGLITARFHTLHNRVQTSNKAHDKFVPRRDCACADHSRPSLSTALLSGWSSHLVLIGFRLTAPLSQAPSLGQDELTRRKRDLDTRGLTVRLRTFIIGFMTARFHTLQKKSVLVRLGAHVYKVHLTKNRTK